MQNFHILNSKETKQVLQLLKSQFDFTAKLDYAFLKNKEDIYIISKDLSKIDTKKFRINNLGLYFGELKHNSIRLSIEGSQLLGHNCSKNILSLNREQMLAWLAGENIGINSEMKGYIIVKHNQDFLGSGVIKNGILLNHVPKERRLNITF